MRLAYVDAPEQAAQLAYTPLMSEGALNRARSRASSRRCRPIQGGSFAGTAGTHDFPRLASRWPRGSEWTNTSVRRPSNHQPRRAS